MAEMREKRREAQPSGIKTFGSTFVNPDDPRAEGRSAGQLLDAAGAAASSVGGARLSPKHANFVENTGDATTADILALMAAAPAGSTSASASCSSPRSRCSARSSGRTTGSCRSERAGRSLRVRSGAARLIAALAR